MPWGRLGAEGAVIVVSILLAFTVQALWERREERRLEVERLEALSVEVADVVARIPVAVQTIQATIASHEALIRQFPGNSLAPADSLIYWLGAVGRPNAFNPPQIVLTDLMSSGGIQEVQADPVRRAIAQYESRLAAHEERLDASWEIWTERIQPYLEGRVSRVDRLRLGPYARDGGPDLQPGSVPFAASPFAADYAGLFADPVFESMLAERWMRLRQAASTRNQIETAATDLLELIDQDLNRD